MPVLEAWIPQRASNAIYRAAFADALVRARMRWPGLRDIAFGDLFLQDIRTYRETLCAELDWTPRFPIFDVMPGHTARLARRMIAGGLRLARWHRTAGTLGQLSFPLFAVQMPILQGIAMLGFGYWTGGLTALAGGIAAAYLTQAFANWRKEKTA